MKPTPKPTEAVAIEAAHAEVVAKEVTRQVSEACGCGSVDCPERIKVVAAALAACAREAKLEQAEESEQALLAARKFVRGRHSVLTFGPRVLLEQLDLALLRITKLRLEVSGERAVGEKGQA